MRKFICLLVVTVLYSSCGTNYKETKFRDKYMFSVELDHSDFTEDISYTDKMGLMIIPVQIEGKTYNFLFDTGSVTMVSPELENTLVSIEDESHFAITDALGNENETNFSVLPKITIGDIDFLHVGVNVHDLSAFQTRCVSIDGIIGANLMRTCFWKIDFTNKTISFSDNKENIQIPNPEIILSFKESFGGNPRTRLKWAQWDFWTTWDTGYNNLIQIPDSLFFKGDKYKETPLISGKGIEMTTLYGNNTNIDKQNTALLDSILFIDEMTSKTTLHANLLLTDQQILIAPYPAEPLFGTKFMETAEVILFDWKNHQVDLKKIPSSSASETFGFAPFKIGDVVQVVSVWENSPAKKQGLNIGDTIVSFYGKNIQNITQEKWCQRFMTASKKDSIIFTVKNGQTRNKFSLGKYRFFSK